MLTLVAVALALSLAPFSGPTLPGSVAGTTKFTVRVSGTSGQSVRLRAVGVPKGYIASFCTAILCAPSNVVLSLPASGRSRLELQLIENTAGAAKPRIVTVAANGRYRASIAFSRGTH